MEKVLETKLKLYSDIQRLDNNLMYNIREIAKTCENILLYSKDSESTEDNVILKLTKEQFQTIEDLVYTAKSEKLVSQNTAQWFRDYSREKEIKQEILDSL